jgi:DNA-binding response OmpR family regulator
VEIGIGQKRIKTREQTYMELMVENDGRIHQRTHLIN